jgi:hypothetical protein
MILQYIIVDNLSEIEKAERLGIPVPKQRHVKRSLAVDINNILYARVTRDGYIEISIINDFFIIDYSEDIWQTIVNAINERERNTKDTY